jgi:chromosome partitioning protein
MRRIALVNQKGGCGKTTTAINLASCLARQGKRVLIIDLDPQGHVALGMGLRTDELENSIYEVLSEKIPLSRAIVNLTENLDGVFSDVVLSAFEQSLAGVPDREKRLARSLESISGKYEYLVIDSPPSVGLLTFNGLLAAREVIIPVDPSYFSLHGLSKLLETIRIIEEQAQHELSVGILATNVDKRTNFCQRVLGVLDEHFSDRCFHTVIRSCTKIREASSMGESIIEYDDHCNAYKDYQRFAEEVLKREPATTTDRPLRDTSSSEPQREEDGKKAVMFTIEAPFNADVKIAGDFNQWMPETLHFNDFHGKPAWHKLMRLSPGCYHYKYIIDGKWVADPDNEKMADNLMGGINSILEL